MISPPSCWKNVGWVSGRSAGTKRMGEQVLLAGVAGEIVALPVDDAARFMPFDQAVVA